MPEKGFWDLNWNLGELLFIGFWQEILFMLLFLASSSETRKTGGEIAQRWGIFFACGQAGRDLIQFPSSHAVPQSAGAISECRESQE